MFTDLHLFLLRITFPLSEPLGIGSKLSPSTVFPWLSLRAFIRQQPLVQAGIQHDAIKTCVSDHAVVLEAYADQRVNNTSLVSEAESDPRSGRFRVVLSLLTQPLFDPAEGPSSYIVILIIILVTFKNLKDIASSKTSHAPILPHLAEVDKWSDFQGESNHGRVERYSSDDLIGFHNLWVGCREEFINHVAQGVCPARDTCNFQSLDPSGLLATGSGLSRLNVLQDVWWKNFSATASSLASQLS
ncbi:hypothetical protein Tco_0739543 [Tanacetum coccineum]